MMPFWDIDYFKLIILKKPKTGKTFDLLPNCLKGIQIEDPRKGILFFIFFLFLCKPSFPGRENFMEIQQHNRIVELLLTCVCYRVKEVYRKKPESGKRWLIYHCDYCLDSWKDKGMNRVACSRVAVMEGSVRFFPLLIWKHESRPR